jgi:GTPase
LLVAGRRFAPALRDPGQHPVAEFRALRPTPGDLPVSYRRYLVDALREDFGLPGSPIRMMLRKGKNPYDAR